MQKHKTKNVEVGLVTCLYPYVQVVDFIKYQLVSSPSKGDKHQFLNTTTNKE